MAKEKDTEKNEIIAVSESEIRNLIYTIRGQQVMIDSDLAMLYQVETRRLNESVKRNIGRFPETERHNPKTGKTTKIFKIYCA